MTDRFEEAVRQAAQGLGAGSSSGMPGYEGAWQRGRRRRVVKQAGLAFVGACALVVALGVNAGRVGNSPVDVDDVATGFEAATALPAQTAPPTTPPIAVPSTGAIQEQPVVPSTAGGAPATEEPTIPADAATQSQVAPSSVPPPPTPIPSSPPAAAAESGPAPTSEPTSPPATANTPVPTSAPTADATAGDPEPTPDATRTQNSPGATETATSQAEVTPAGPGSTLPVAPAGADVDAVLIGAVLVGENGLATSPCDSNADGEPDSMCELFPSYPCLAVVDARPGYTTADNDEDGVIDTCRAVVLTRCDSTGDGVADVFCVITPNDITTEPPTDE